MAGVPVVLITANVGSIFEEPKDMLKIWTEEFLSTITRLDPKFIALHCQEVGGKNYEQSMRHVEDFVRLLMSSEELRLFDKVRVYLDEDFSSPEHFTALGNFYFIHDSLKDVLLWDFKDCKFLPVNGKEVHSGNIEAVSTKEKAKFPQDFFPECKWSRKGFLRTRWSISGTIFDLINIHLFHDASNFVAMETFPSVYSKTRRRALEHTLDRIHSDHYPNAPYFVFGDFNFRTDTSGVIQKLTQDTQENKTSAKGSISKLQFRNNDDVVVLTLGKKEFSHHLHQNVFIENGGQWLREFDKELEDFNGRLFEFPIKFIPSYPFEEDIQEGTNYMQTRVPAWCDRILLNPTARSLIQNIQSGEVEYGLIGASKCMGDHKPVYLKINLALDSGMINCCQLPNNAQFCFRVPDTYLELVSMLPDSRSCAKAFSTDRSSNFLHATPVKHDPYTPDSMESPSPNAMAAAGYTPLDIESSERSEDSEQRPKSDKTVSPALLKSKLELIAKIESRESEIEVEIHHNPSSHRLQGSSDADNDQTELGRNRSNSDVSWKKKKLSQTEGDSDYGFHSYDNILDIDVETGEKFLHPVSFREIPRIKIINASNVVSNESCFTDNAAGSSSETRTKSGSIEGSVGDKTDDTVEEDSLLNKIDDLKVDDLTTDDVKNDDVTTDDIKIDGIKIDDLKIDNDLGNVEAEPEKINLDQTNIANPLIENNEAYDPIRNRKPLTFDTELIIEIQHTEHIPVKSSQESIENAERAKMKKPRKKMSNCFGKNEHYKKRCCVIS